MLYGDTLLYVFSLLYVLRPAPYSVVVARGDTRNIKENTQKKQHLVAIIYLMYSCYSHMPSGKLTRSGGLAKRNKKKEGARAMPHHGP